MKNLDYNESTDALDIRIRAHLEFSSWKMEDVLEELMARLPSSKILDVGCGSGNYSDLFAKHCVVYAGLDKSKDLLAQAQEKCRQMDIRNALFMTWDMNDDFAFLPGSFDFVFYGYSAYYADDALSLIRRSKGVLDAGGTLCLVGPIPGNAVELDLLSEALFGIPSSDEKEIRLRRLQEEFVPLISQEFGNHEVLEKDFSLTFPTVSEYAKYFAATPQYLELEKRFGKPEPETINREIERLTALRLTKKAAFVLAGKT